MARVIETGKNGNCLFTSLGHAMGINHIEIRRRVADYALKHPQSELMQETVRDWVSKSTNQCVRHYSEEIRHSGNYGSALELALVSKIYDQRIVVWIPIENTIEKGIRSIAEYRGNRPTIHLLYRNEHYQLLSFD